MNKLLKNEFALSRASRVLWFGSLIVFLMVSIVSYFHLYNGIEDIVRDQAVSSITNISQLNEDSVSRSIVNRRTLLEMLAARIEKREMYDIDDILAELDGFS